MTSAAKWLVWRTGIAPATASAVVKIAERSTDLPETMAALRRGELSLDQAASIARKAPAWCDEQARDYGRSMTVPQLRTVLGSYPYPVLDDNGKEIRNASPPSEVDEPPAAANTSGEAASGDGVEHGSVADEWCSITIGDDGMYRLSAGLHPENGDVVRGHSMLRTTVCSKTAAPMSTSQMHCV
jgi:hypothetical protein